MFEQNNLWSNVYLNNNVGRIIVQMSVVQNSICTNSQNYILYNFEMLKMVKFLGNFAEILSGGARKRGGMSEDPLQQWLHFKGPKYHFLVL